MIYQEEQLQNQFNQLPDAIKDFILSEQVQSDINDIIDDYFISDSKKFKQLVFGLLVGASDSDTFIHELEEELQIPEGASDEIFSDITKYILEPLHEVFTVIINSVNNPPQELADEPQLTEALENQSEPVHTLDLEIPPLNLPMIETQEEHDRLVAQYAAEQAKPVETKNYNERVQSAASTLASMLQSRGTGQGATPQPSNEPIQQSVPPQTPQFSNSILEKYYNETTTPIEVSQNQPTPPESQAPQPHFPPTTAPKFSYHDKDPYREPPEP